MYGDEFEEFRRELAYNKSRVRKSILDILLIEDQHERIDNIVLELLSEG